MRIFRATKPFHSAILLAAATMGLSAMASHGQLLLSDDFTVSGPGGQISPNFEIDGGRQSGLLAPSPYALPLLSGDNVQTGNADTDVGQPGGASNSNYLLISWSSFQNELAIDATLADGKPLQFSFDLYTGTTVTGNWLTFSIGNSGDAWPLRTAFALLVQGANSGAQLFRNNGTQYGTLPAEVMPSSLWTITLSDAAGTGSAFADNGTRVVIMNGDTMVSDEILATEFGSSSSFRMGFYAYSLTGGVDNLSVSTVPEPATTSFLIAAGIGLAAVARKRRRG